MTDRRIASGRRRYSPGNRASVSTLSVVAFLALWECAPTLGLLDPAFGSQPSRVLAAGVAILRDGSFFGHLGTSLLEFAIGFALAVGIAVPAGLLLGTLPRLRYLLDPPIMAVYATPELALLPILVVWLGVGIESKVAATFIGASIPIVVNSIAGVRQVDRSMVLAARSFCAGTFDTFLKVILPASFPAVLTGLRLAVSRGVLAVVVAEMYVSQRGLGNQIILFGSAFRMDHLLFYVLLVSALGFAGTASLRRLEGRVRR